MKPLKANAADVARIIMKEQARGTLKYQRLHDKQLDMHHLPHEVLDPSEEAQVLRRIPSDELEAVISEEHKALIKRMRGERVDHAFSNYARFKQPTIYEKEALDYNKHNFSIIDIHDKVFNSPGK